MAAIIHSSIPNGPLNSVPVALDHVNMMRARSRPSLDANPLVSEDRSRVELPRAASYTYLGNAKENHYTKQATLASLKLAAADIVSQLEDEVLEISPPDSSGWNTPDEKGGLTIAAPRAQEIAEKLQNVSSSRKDVQGHSREDTRSSVGSSTRLSRTSLDSTRTTSTAATTPVSGLNRQSISRSLTKRFSRQSWYQTGPRTPSRSPSPLKEDAGDAIQIPPAVATEPTRPPLLSELPRRRSLLPGRNRSKSRSEKKGKPLDTPSCDLQEPAQVVTRKDDSLRKRARPVSQIFRFNSAEVPDLQPSRTESIPSVPRLPKSFSTDKLVPFRSHPGQTPIERAAPVPRLVPSDRGPGHPSAAPKKKDELWSVFRSLDGDYVKFASKTTAMKANVVRSTLMPFLTAYATHPSNRTLRPEDLDRRTNILNKWWTGLLEMLHGRNNQSISGTDRPVILDGIAGIMERPEWRLAPSPFCPVDQRLKETSARFNQSTASISSTSSGFLAESVHHNVRNIFIQNLCSQMAFVVDKMSLRNASASLVAFCGKACAYAFMFVPGVADVLVRLWETPMDLLRRVLGEYGIGKFVQVSESESNAILSNFPPALQKLGFSSLMKHMRKLRTPPPLPLGTSSIQWWGRWLDRWTGKESDLFYIFAKHYHILITDFLPTEPSKRDRVCIPGLLLVHAQILANLDATIHRDANTSAPDNSEHSPTFDDVLVDPDAHASTLPAAPTNAVRLMAENRLIMLIRDFLSERVVNHPMARRLFAQSFNDLLQASASGTSKYDYLACYTLLDFLEEALVILVRYEQQKECQDTIINSSFWQSVCKEMISSENTMTEIRLYAFLYTVWSTVVTDPLRRRNICLGLILDEEIFQSRFNHWCPMVRAYYMRLLCWRLGRFDGEIAGSDDLDIMETLLERLRTSWSFYLWLRDEAEGKTGSLPATNPCFPAPGRRLLIIRTDAPVTANAFLAFGALAPPPLQQPSPPGNAWKRLSSVSALVEGDSRPTSSYSSIEEDADGPAEKGLGGFLRKMIGSRPRDKSPQAVRTSAPRAQLDRRASIQDIPSSKPAAAAAASHTDLVPPHRNYSFKFSLEYVHHAKAPPSLRLYPPRLALPAQLALQASSPWADPTTAVAPCAPQGANVARARYAGRALAEWMLVVGECQSFFDRRKSEGVPGNRQVETPTLSVEVFKRPS